MRAPSLVDRLTRSIFAAIKAWERETGGRFDRKMFEIRVHPSDWELICRIAPAPQHLVFGVPVAEDETIPEGRPEIRSTWRRVL